MKLNVFVDKLEKIFPLSNQLEGDKSGLFWGNDNREIRNVMVSLDITLEEVNFAIKNDIDIIISHHPVSFANTVEEAMEENFVKKTIISRLMKANIAIYSAHTSADCAKEGMNYWLANKLSLLKPEFFNDENIGMIGNTVAPYNMEASINKIQRILGVDYIRKGFVDTERKVNRVAVIGGSGSQYMYDAIKADADLIVTSDVKWHHWLAAKDERITIIDVGHYVEHIFIKEVSNIIIDRFKLNSMEYHAGDIVEFQKSTIFLSDLSPE